jgi:transcriptional regulator with XRE-family HTH domain
VPRPPKETLISKKEVGTRVRALRQARDLSQGELAALLAIPSTNVSAIERGVRGLSLQQLAKLAKALDVSPGEILNGHPQARHQSRLPRRLERIRGLPRTKRRILFEIIDAFLDKHDRSA